MKKNKNLDKYNMLIKQILALHFSGCYITNKELVNIGKKIKVEVDLADREKVFKDLLAKAINEKKETIFFNELSNLLKQRFEEYKKLSLDFPNSKEIIYEWMQKLKSIDRLIKQKIKMNPYE